MADIVANVTIPGNIKISSDTYPLDVFSYTGTTSLTANVPSDVVVPFNKTYNQVPRVFATLVSSGYTGQSPTSPLGIVSIYVHQVTTTQATIRVIGNTSQSTANFVLLVIP